MPLPQRRCIYCGGSTRGRACQGHSDLLRLDIERNPVITSQVVAARRPQAEDAQARGEKVSR